MSEILEANLQNAARLVVSNTRRGRPRSKDAHKRIINATLDLLAEKGFAGVTIETIARQAHVGKSTIYRHWKSKTELVEEALDLEIARLSDDCDSGDLAKDLHHALDNLAKLFSGRSGIALARVVGEAQSNPKLRALIQERWKAAKNGGLASIISRGIRAGQVKGESNPNVIAEIATGVMLLRSLISGEPIDNAYREQLSFILLGGIAKADLQL